MEIALSVLAALIAGVILLIIEYRTHWFARGLDMPLARLSPQARSKLVLRAFVDELILNAKDPSITPENVEIVRKLLLTQVENAINSHLIARLSFKDKLALSRLLDANAPEEEINKFFANHIPDMESEVGQALLDFRTSYLVGRVSALMENHHD